MCPPCLISCNSKPKRLNIFIDKILTKAPIIQLATNPTEFFLLTKKFKLAPIMPIAIITSE